MTESIPDVTSPIEILLVDDHPHVRKLLRELIETYEDLKVVGEATNGEEAVLLSATLNPAVVVMDVHLPVVSGIVATTLIKRAHPFTTIIGLTAGDPGQDAEAMTIAGAAGIIDKGAVFDALHSTIIDAVQRTKNLV